MATASKFSGHTPVNTSVNFLDLYNSEGPKGPASHMRSYASLSFPPIVHEYEEALGFTLGDPEGLDSFMKALFGGHVKVEGDVAILSGVTMGDITSTLNANLPPEVSFVVSSRAGDEMSVVLVPKETNLQDLD